MHFEKKRDKSSLGALFYLQPPALDSHALLMSLNILGNRSNSNLSHAPTSLFKDPFSESWHVQVSEVKKKGKDKNLYF